MRILLVGDYSSVHLELRNSLKNQNIDVILASSGDGYKNFSRDIDLKIKSKRSNHIFAKFFRVIMDYLGFKGIFTYFSLRKKIKLLTDFQVIQLINTAPIGELSSIPNLLLIKRLLKQNPNAKLYTLAAGDDFAWTTWAMQNSNKSYFKDFKIKHLPSYLYSLKYKYGFFYHSLHRFVVNQSTYIIPILQDYYDCYKSYKNCYNIIPIGLNESLFKEPLKNTTYPIKIFHGWQKHREIAKGNIYFDISVKNLLSKFDSHYVQYQVAQNIPYVEYIKIYEDADIFLDQCFSVDCGVNALLGMAKGKVVFSGFNDNDNHTIGINASPNTDQLVDDLISLIENPKKIDLIKRKAYAHSYKKHHIQNISLQFLTAWEVDKRDEI